MTDTLIPLCGLYENTSQKTGRRYFTGYLGKAKLVMFEAKDAKDGEPQWTLFVGARPERRDSGASRAREEGG